MPSSVHAIEQAIIDALGSVSRLDVGTIDRSTRLLDVGMDSLSLVAALTQIEAAIDAPFSADEIAELLRARDVAELVAVVSRKRDGVRDGIP